MKERNKKKLQERRKAIHITQGIVFIFVVCTTLCNTVFELIAIYFIWAELDWIINIASYPGLPLMQEKIMRKLRERKAW